MKLEIGSIQKGLYEHYKGKPYEILDIGFHTEKRETVVIYKALYEGDFPEGTLWVRPLTMFKESVIVEGREVPRFRYIGPPEK